MSGTTPPGGTGRRFRRLAAGLVLIVLLGFLGTNLLLGSPWGRARVADRMAAKTGLEWVVGGASWSPWGGVRLRGLEARAGVSSGPDPGVLLRIEELQVRPHWARLLRGELVPREVRVERPAGNVPVELLAALTPARRPVNLGPDPPPPAAPAPEDPAAAPETEEAAPAGETPVTEAPAAAGEGPRDATPPAAPGPAGRLVVTDGSLRIYSLRSGRPGLLLEGITVDTPVSGPASGGAFRVERIALGGVELPGPLGADLAWERPALSLEPTVWTCGGVPVRVAGRIVPGGSMPMALELHAPRSEVSPVELSGLPGAAVGIGELEVVARLRGGLARPASWNADLLVGAREVRLLNNGRPVLAFREGRLAAGFNGGVLQVADARLVGDSLSLLGNGALHYSGRVLGVVRLVANWEYAEALSRMASGAGWSRSTQRWLTPFETPDRLYRDIHLEGSLPEATVDVGLTEQGLPLPVALDRITRFARGEKWEEDHGEGHDPRWDALLLQQ